MRLTIIRDDGVVGIDGVFRRVDMSGLPTGIRALQWNGSTGHLEHDNGSNMPLTGIAIFQLFVDRWNAAALPPLTTAQQIEAARGRINAAYENSVSAMTAGYPSSEIKSWDKQETEARNWQADNAALTPWIDAAAGGRGMPKAVLVARIIAKANIFAVRHGELTGKRQRLDDEITALGDSPSQAQLDEIIW